jgi:polyisoprenoid-binding protein YceI
VAVSPRAAALLATMAFALWLAPAAVVPLRAAGIDASASRIGFALKTRWGQGLEGRFPVFRGEVEALPGQRHRVRLLLSAREVEIVDHPAYTKHTRGRGFFDAERFPEVAFISQPYPSTLLQSGGALAGILSIRGVSRSETFQIEPASCGRPGLDCDIVAQGDVRRSDYGMGRWGLALADEVRFSLRIRTRAPLP